MSDSTSVLTLKKQFITEMSIASQNMRDIRKALTASELVFLVTYKAKKRG